MRPNVLFLFTDDQRFDTIGALGNPVVKTPNLDRLAKRGVAFTKAFIAGGSCPAVCMPSRAMLHSGRGLFRIEDKGQDIPRDHTTLGEAFRNAGYETFATGKWHNGIKAFARSFSQGADIFFGGMDDHWNVPLVNFDPTGRYDSRKPVCRIPTQNNDTKTRYVDHIHLGCHSTDIFGDAAVSFLEGHNTANPFLAYVSFMAPHDPRTMPKQFLDMYPPEEIPLPPNFLPEHPFDHGARRVRDERLEEFPRRPQRIRQHIAEYYAMISHLDFQIGRILETLEHTGMAENTIVVFAGDNGLALGQHGLMGKQSVYDHSVRVPLIFAGPGIPAAKREDIAVLYDVFPTLCGLCGLDVPDSVLGSDLFAKDRQAPEAICLAYAGSQRAIRTRTHKLIEYLVRDERHTQLFDLETDPWEVTNLADDPSSANILGELRSIMLTQKATSGDEATPLGKEFWAKAGNLG